ncbi:MAG: phenylalanine--tRNA ligase subunit alpha, partial [Candidatus Omnitrophica bacterium]|nr:phenylalanine--tRNA ligase subunit alpha [Candidatus Omnitrophota bacterium]
MKERLRQLEKEINENLEGAITVEELEKLRIKYVGRKGELTVILKNIRDVAEDERPYVGQKVNELKRVIEKRIERGTSGESKGRPSRREAPDVTLPGARYELGRQHPISQTIQEICGILQG